MLRTILITAAVVAGFIATGLGFGWDFWFFDDPDWLEDYHGWVACTVALFAAALHPAVAWADRRYHR